MRNNRAGTRTLVSLFEIQMKSTGACRAQHQHQKHFNFMKTNKENMLRPSHTQMKEDGILLHPFIDFSNFMSRYAFDFLLFNRIKANSIQTNENAIPTNRIIQRDSDADCGRRISYLALRAIKDGIGLRSDFSRAVVLVPVHIHVRRLLWNVRNICVVLETQEISSGLFTLQHNMRMGFFHCHLMVFLCDSRILESTFHCARKL